MQLVGQAGQGLVGHLVDGALPQRVLLHPGVREPLGQVLSQFVGQQPAGTGFGLGQQGTQGARRVQVDMQRLARAPVAGDLQHGGPTQPPVGEQQVFVEDHALFAGTCGDGHGQGQPGQLGVGHPSHGVKVERHQGWAGFDHPQAKLARQAQAEVGGANFGHWQAAGGHHHR